MILLLIDVNEIVVYKVKNYWMVNYYVVLKYCGLVKFVLEYIMFMELV